MKRELEWGFASSTWCKKITRCRIAIKEDTNIAGEYLRKKFLEIYWGGRRNKWLELLGRIPTTIRLRVNWNWWFSWSPRLQRIPSKKQDPYVNTSSLAKQTIYSKITQIRRRKGIGKWNYRKNLTGWKKSLRRKYDIRLHEAIKWGKFYWKCRVL